jgi:uncharacterized protein YhfF
MQEAWWRALPVCAFGSSPAMQERLAALVIARRKRATVWDGREPNPTLPGMRWVVTVLERPVAVIDTALAAAAPDHVRAEEAEARAMLAERG